MAQVNAERAAAARGEPPPTPPQQPQEPQPPLGSAPTPTPPPLPTPTPTPSSADVDVLSTDAPNERGADRQASRGDVRARGGGAGGTDATATDRVRAGESGAGRAVRRGGQGGAGAQGSDGARGVTRPVGAIRPVLRKYIILPRAIFIVVFSHTSERTGCLVLAPRSPRPESPSASRQTKSPSPSGGRGLPSHPGVGGPPRPRPLPPPLARGWNTSGHTPGHARPRHPRSPDVPAARAEEPSEPASEPASAPSEPASSAAPRKPGHATRVTEPAPAHAARVEIVLAPRDTRRVPGHTPKHTAGRYPDPRRGIPSRVANRELRVATTPRLPIRRAASTPRRRERAFRTCLVRLLVRLILRRDAERGDVQRGP